MGKEPIIGISATRLGDFYENESVPYSSDSAAAATAAIKFETTDSVKRWFVTKLLIQHLVV